MTVKSPIVALAVLLFIDMTLPAAAQDPPKRPPSPRPRVEVNPGPRLLYRRCNYWYEIQHRPSGTVLFPAQHCWWVRG
jgi:hypothetical protein